MLNVYATTWCPHCTKTVNYLKENKIDFNYINMEDQLPKHVVEKIVNINGGDDWVVPTLEFNGKWRKGQFFNETSLQNDLKKMGVIP